MSNLAEVAAGCYRQLAETKDPVKCQWSEFTLVLRRVRNHKKLQLLVFGRRHPSLDERVIIQRAFAVPGEATEAAEDFEQNRVIKWTWFRPAATQLALIVPE